MARRYFAALAILLLFPLSCLAETKIPVNIKADKLKYYEDAGQVEASGSVEVKLKQVTIYADRVRLDAATNITTADGHVRIASANYSARADGLTYDADKENSSFQNFSAQFSPSKLKGNMYVKARQLNDLGQEIKGNDGSSSTCDDEPQHYFIAADRIYYYPDKRIDAWNATVHVGELPVFWAPYIYYDLEGERRRNWTFGHNAVEGDFIKTTWAIPAGIMLVDLMSKKGLGLGLQSGFSLSKGQGDYTLYHVDEKDTGISDWVEKINYQLPLNDKTTLGLRHNYLSTYQLPSGRVEQTAFGLNLKRSDTNSYGIDLAGLDDRGGNLERYNVNLSQATSRESASYSLNYEFAKTDPQWLRNSQRFNFQSAINERVSFSTTANYYRSVANSADQGEEKIEPAIQLTGSEANFSWRYSQNWLVDLKSDLYPDNQHYEYLEKQPEIEIAPKAVDLKYFTLSSKLGYGKYRENKYVTQLGQKRDYTSDKASLSLNANKSLPLKLGTTLVLGAGIDQFLYSAGDRLYALRESAALQTELGGCFRNNLSFQQAYTAGNTPFFFDQVGTRYHDIRETLTFYYLSLFNWTWDGGHNWQTNKYYDVMTRLNINPNERLGFNFSSGWDIENRVYKDVVSGVHIVPLNFYTFDLSLTRDINAGEMRSGNAAHDLYILKGAENQIHLQVNQVYDPATKEFKVRDIMLVKDLHCWEMKYSYSDYYKQFSLVFSLKAMPGEPVSYSTGRGFYYEGIDRELNKLNPQSEIRRY